MHLTDIPFGTTDWNSVESTTAQGEAGSVTSRTRQFGGIRVRMIEYSAGYLADHWCPKGHVILCLEGFLDIELADGARHALKPGHSYHVGDGGPPHRSRAPEGARLFIVD